MSLLDNAEFVQDLKGDLSGVSIARKWGCSESTARQHRINLAAKDGLPEVEKIAKLKAADEAETHDVDLHGNVTLTKRADRIIPLSEWLDGLRKDGLDPADYSTSHGHSVYMQHTRSGETKTLYANRFSATKKSKKDVDAPSWQPVDRGPAHVVAIPAKRSGATLVGRWKTAVLASDTQIGFRELADGTNEPFHDAAAIGVFLDIVDIERPEQVVMMGDILDFAQVGRYTQEAGFARTMQPTIDTGTKLAADIRARTSGEVVFLEGNHDKRLQNFVEANAIAAFGLRKGGMPDSWPVMSLPNLLRLDEVNVRYMDAYPAAHWWVNDQLRCEHGTRANSSGSTAAQYMNDTPHISRAHGHHHRLEAQSKTTYDRMGKIKSVAISPGCLCRVDGAVPSVHGAIGANGKSAEVVENWQNGVAVIRFKDSGEFFWNLVQIEDGETIYEGQEIAHVTP